MRIDPRIGVALNWLVNADVKWILMQHDVCVNSGAVPAQANINPSVISAALRYRC